MEAKPKGPVAFIVVALLRRYLDWLHQEVTAGYDGSVWDYGVATQGYAWNDAFPKTAIAALADYRLLTVSERAAAIRRAEVIVIDEIERISLDGTPTPELASSAKDPRKSEIWAAEHDTTCGHWLDFLIELERERQSGYADKAVGGVSALMPAWRSLLPDVVIEILRGYSEMKVHEREAAVSQAEHVLRWGIECVSSGESPEGFSTKAWGARATPTPRTTKPTYHAWLAKHGYRDVDDWGRLESDADANRVTPPRAARRTPPSASDGLSVAGLRAMPYQEYLRTDHWRRVRQLALERADHRCQLCYSPRNLQVHHRTYKRRGAERDNDLLVLCDDCHARFHETHPDFARRPRTTNGVKRTYRTPRAGNYGGGMRATKIPRKRASPWQWIVPLLAVLALLGGSAVNNRRHAVATESVQAPTSGALMATYDANANGTATAFRAATATSAPTATSAQPSSTLSQLAYGSWVAYAPDIGVRFFAPPSVVEVSGETHAPDSYHLFSPSRTVDGGYEVLDIFRYRNRDGGAGPGIWTAQNNAFLTAIDARDYSVTHGPSPQQIGAYSGQRGQFNYAQANDGVRISGTMWVGQVGPDIVVITYRCEPSRERQLDREMTQIMNTIDFNAR